MVEGVLVEDEDVREGREDVVDDEAEEPGIATVSLDLVAFAAVSRGDGQVRTRS